MKHLLVIITFFVFVTPIASQDSAYARKIVDTLTSSHFWGRGYTKDGMKAAGNFIANEFKSSGLIPMDGSSYHQYFSYPVNTFPGRMEVKINGKQLSPGKDFIVGAQSKGVKGHGALEQKDRTTFIDHSKRIALSLVDKLTWTVSTRQADHTEILVNKPALDQLPYEISANIEAVLDKEFQAANICGLVKGNRYPDSVIVFTAHYDHLGGMGDTTFFPGANDNASGVAMLLSLARYYAAHPPPYSIAFIAFAGEEAGLIGSKHFTNNPLLPLSSIRFLVNLDLVGTGQEGITVVNATEFAHTFAMLNKLNSQHNLLVDIKARGKAANSDHYWFSEKGVPAFFIYTVGGIKAYHDVDDRPETLAMIEYNDLFLLLTGFAGMLMNVVQ